MGASVAATVYVNGCIRIVDLGHVLEHYLFRGSLRLYTNGGCLVSYVFLHVEWM